MSWWYSSLITDHSFRIDNCPFTTHQVVGQSWYAGNRGAEDAWECMNDVADRLKNRVQLTTDGHRAYLIAVQNAFDNDIDFAQLLKMYGGSEGTRDQDKKYSPAECTGTKKTRIAGDPNLKFVSTS